MAGVLALPGREVFCAYRVDLWLLKNREVAAANAIRFLFAITFFGSCLLFPAYFQQVLGKTPLESGLLLIPQTLSAAAVMPIMGRLIEKRGPRGVVLTGPTLVVVSAKRSSLRLNAIQRQPQHGRVRRFEIVIRCGRRAG
jgi:predicted MFS family arabinose efflux permease